MYGKSKISKIVTLVVAMVATLSLFVTSALATETASSQVAITGGSLTGGDIHFTNFSAIELDGTKKSATATWTIANIVDARGTGTGWNTTLQLTQFKEWAADAYVTDGQVLAMDSVTVTTVPSLTDADDTSSLPSDIAIVTLGTPLDTLVPVKLLMSDINEGMGSYAVTDMTVTLNVPANVHAAAYKTDATVALVTGP
jgi:hypothetical protein